MKRTRAHEYDWGRFKVEEKREAKTYLRKNKKSKTLSVAGLWCLMGGNGRPGVMVMVMVPGF